MESEIVYDIIEHESRGLKVLVVNATEEFRRNDWILATNQDYSPVVAANMIPHKFVVCNELSSVETVFSVLCNSAKQGVKKAIVIGHYDFTQNNQILKRWRISYYKVERTTVYVFNKIGKTEHQSVIAPTKDFRSLVQVVNKMEKQKVKRN